MQAPSVHAYLHPKNTPGKAIWTISGRRRLGSKPDLCSITRIHFSDVDVPGMQTAPAPALLVCHPIWSKR